MGTRWFKAVAPLVAVAMICAGCGSSAAPQGAATQNPIAVRAAFIKGLDDFCRVWYTDQKQTFVRFPGPAQQRQYDRVVAAKTKRDDRLLADLHPLSTMDRSFARFVANEKAIYRSRVLSITDDADGQSQVAADAFNKAIDRRHAIARAYGARECDGLLPPAQRRAAVAALRHYELNRSPHRACFTLVTREFTRAQFPSADPDATCLQHFSAEYSGLYPVPTGISVSSVSGVEHLSATVNFTELPDCGCGPLAVRLYFEHGRWLINEGYHVQPVPARLSA